MKTGSFTKAAQAQPDKAEGRGRQQFLKCNRAHFRFRPLANPKIVVIKKIASSIARIVEVFVLLAFAASSSAARPPFSPRTDWFVERPETQCRGFSMSRRPNDWVDFELTRACFHYPFGHRLC